MTYVKKVYKLIKFLRKSINNLNPTKFFIVSAQEKLA